MQVFDAREQLISVAEGSANAADSSHLNDNTSLTDDTPPTQASSVPESPKDSTELVGTENTEDTASVQPSFLGDAIKKNKNRSNHMTGKARTWLWSIATLILVLIASIQSIYFLRDEIAIYYPNAKPYLVQACQKLSCSINLPKKIEFIVIDDSDMQEDANHPGLVRFASTLINSGNHVVAYPNLELTLTDVEDKPVLRRIFKPNEYLPADTVITDGIQANAETRIKLAVTTSDISVTGYRVFVTY
jgi:hypothetical protein